MKLPILLHAVTSDDGKRCAPECMHRNGADDLCEALGRSITFDGDVGAWVRADACIAASAAAVEHAGIAMCDVVDLVQEHLGRAEAARFQEAIEATDGRTIPPVALEPTIEGGRGLGGER